MVVLVLVVVVVIVLVIVLILVIIKTFLVLRALSLLGPVTLVCFQPESYRQV